MAKYIETVALLRIESHDSGNIPANVPKLRYWIKDDEDSEFDQRGLIREVPITPATTWQAWWDDVIQQISTDAGI